MTSEKVEAYLKLERELADVMDATGDESPEADALAENLGALLDEMTPAEMDQLTTPPGKNN